MTLAIVLVIALLAFRIHGQEISHDQCVDEAFSRFHASMTSRFPQFENFTVSLPSSRHLFQNLLTQGFTKDSLKEYCKAYESARKEYDNCGNSAYKMQFLSGFGLADYICLKKLEEFANGIPCLEKSDQAASNACRPKCRQYEQASYAYLHPSDSLINNGMTTYMAGDCQYLKCWVGCRQPYLAEQCGNNTASLESDSLIAAYSTMYVLYAPNKSSTTPPSQEIHQSAHFPDECKPFVVMDADVFRENDFINPSGPQIAPTTKGPLAERTTHGGCEKPIGKIVEMTAILFIPWMIQLILAF